ncbi:putative ribosomal RNA processing protein 36-like [Apostichopus japonicus]|uniref:rRNA biogenesis protein RRP36 n=1 Tax=Stichopus japonicus TaxID=307972 RepID=A0A2G8L508_STIJA|nr:putative ribosomal RNA processing protein 36-like [Apostichopus japonicus]
MAQFPHTQKILLSYCLLSADIFGAALTGPVRPLEMSSKRPVRKPQNVMNAPKRVSRDPRFDDLSGSFDEETFEEDYSFVKDIQEKERQSVEMAMKNCEDEEEAERLKKLLYRMKQQDIARKKKESKRKIENKLKMQEMEQVKQGKKPYFIKKSDRKILELAEQYKDLKKSGKLEKYLTKKRKKNIAKDRAHMPSVS